MISRFQAHHRNSDSQRILNGEPRQLHYGIDIAAVSGTPVTAPVAGHVTMRDLHFSGWTLPITHGMGLNAAFLHLDTVAVNEGEEVARGQVIGTVGSTDGQQACIWTGDRLAGTAA